MTNRCPKCGTISHPSNVFCASCGTNIQRESSSFKTLVLIAVGFFGVMVLAMVILAGLTRRPEPSPKLAVNAAPPSSATPTPSPTPLSDVARLAGARSLLSPPASVANIDEGLSNLRQIPKESPQYKEAQALIKQGEKLRKEQERVEQKERTEAAVLGPKPENSGWNGKVHCVDRYLKEVLNDYDSAEYVEWSPVTRVDVKGEPYWVVRLKLRATNAFGAKILKDTYYFIRNDQVIFAKGLSAD